MCLWNILYMHIDVFSTAGERKQLDTAVSVYIFGVNISPVRESQLIHCTTDNVKGFYFLKGMSMIPYLIMNRGVHIHVATCAYIYTRHIQDVCKEIFMNCFLFLIESMGRRFRGRVEKEQYTESSLKFRDQEVIIKLPAFYLFFT